MKWNTYFPRIQVRTKKRSSQEMEHFVSPNSSTDLRSDAHQSQIIGEDAGEDHTQIVGGNTVKLLGGYISPYPRVSAPLVAVTLFSAGKMYLNLLIVFCSLTHIWKAFFFKIL